MSASVFTSTEDVHAALHGGEKVEHIYTGVVFFIKNNRVESGVSLNPTADFIDFENYIKYLAG